MSGVLADLSPDDYLREMDGADLFVRNLPEPGKPRCGAKIHPEPAQEIRDRLTDDIVGMTTCHLPPGHARPWRDDDGRMKTQHVGMLVLNVDYGDGPETRVASYTWINPRALGALQ